uniref:MHC class I antigen n=1 Tax=Anisakis simplex TaxID=6269 RepID=A0A0M3J6N4_ANISI
LPSGGRRRPMGGAIRREDATGHSHRHYVNERFV